MKYTIILLMAMSLVGCATKVDVVTLDADSKIYLNGKQIPGTYLSEKLERDEVLIEASDSTPHSLVVAVMEEIKEAGITNVSFNVKN